MLLLINIYLLHDWEKRKTRMRETIGGLGRVQVP